MSPVAEPRSFSNLPQPNSTLPDSPTLIPDEELEEYFNAPITQTPSTFSSPVQQHLKIIEEELQKSFPLDFAVSAKLE